MARLYAATWRVEQPAWPVEGPCVVAFWHGDLLPMILLHARRGLVGLASQSRDGAVVAGVLGALGYGVVRGSTSRGALGALRACRRVLTEGRNPALAVDGPRGPRHVVQAGAESLAKLAGVPVVAGVVEAAGWRTNSWDRFLIPWPFARVKVRYTVWRPGEGPLQTTMEALSGSGG